MSRGLIILLIILSSNHCFGQWKKLFSYPFGPTYAISFIDSDLPKVGFAGIARDLFRTEDGGLTWTKVADDLGIIADFTFKDSLVGWCSLRLNSQAVHKTVDGGRTWLPVAPRFSFSGGEGIYYNRKSQRLFVAAWTRGFNYSLDGGSSWIQIDGEAKGFSGISFINDSIGIVSVVNLQNKFLRSTDYGQTWSNINFTQECWQPLAIKDTNIFLAGCEASGNGLNRSDDAGLTWRKIVTSGLPGSLSGDLKGDLCRLYVQLHRSPSQDGIYRSLNEGMDWSYIGGPSNGWDQRFYVKDRHIYVGDTLGNIWYLYDTVGTVKSAKLELSLKTIEFDSVSPCSHPRIPLVISNPHTCEIVTLNSLDISSPFTLTNDELPFDLLPGSTDTIWIEYGGSSQGSSTTSLKLTTQHENYVLDTQLPVSGFRLGSGKSKVIASGTSIILPQLSICALPIDTTITLRNFGCDTLYINQVPGSLPNGYTLVTPISIPYMLLPDSVLQVTFRFTPTTPGTFKVYPGFRIQLPSSIQDLELYFEVTVIPGDGILSLDPLSFNLPSLSLCDKDTLRGFYTNSGCDSLFVESITLSGDADFNSQTLVSSSLVVGDTIHYSIPLDPKLKGLRNGLITIRTRSRNGLTHDTTIVLSAFITDGIRMLSSGLDNIEFKHSSLCEENDSTFQLSNKGCDTLIISALELTGKGFVLLDTATPIILPPGASTHVKIATLIDTTNGSLSNTGSVKFVSNADNQFQPITFTRSFTYPKNYDIQLRVVEVNGTAGDKVTLQLVAGNWWQSDNVMRGVRRIDFDLKMNNDLLHYINWSGANQLSVANSRITIENATDIVAANGIIAELMYEVHLTRDSSTSIQLEQLLVNGNDTSDCKPMILSTSESGFSYYYVCADRLIQDFMRTGTAKFSIVPNPSSGIISLECSKDIESISLKVYGPKGDLLQSLGTHSISRSLPLELEMSKLPAGLYFIRITSPLMTSDLPFVIQK